MAGFQYRQVERLVAGDDRRAAVLPVLFEVGERKYLFLINGAPRRTL